MRSTNEIVCAVKECKPATEEELRMALMVMCSTEHFLKLYVQRTLEAMEAGKPSAAMWAGEAKRFMQETLFKMHKMDPLQCLGPANTPGNPEHDRFYRAGMALVDRLFKEREAKDGK